MQSGNSFFSFFSNIKDRINSFFTSLTYSSKKDINDLNYSINQKQCESTDDKNYITYLLKKRKRENVNNHYNKKTSGKLRKSYSTTENSYISSTLSEISSQEKYDLNETQINSYNENESILSFYNNNDTKDEQNFKNYYRKNSHKHLRFQFEEENIDNQININDKMCININEEEKGKERKKINKKKKSKTRKEKNYKDVKRLCDEYNTYKKKLKLKNKINNDFQEMLEDNDQINIKRIKKTEKRKLTKIPFENLFYTNPERFSVYSTQKKMKLDKRNSLTISNENNFNYLNHLKTEIKENISEEKPEDKNIGILNISPVKTCEIFKINNISNDFSFGEINNNKCSSDTNLSNLTENNNFSSSNTIQQNNPEQNNNAYNNILQNNDCKIINNNFIPINNTSNFSFNTYDNNNICDCNNKDLSMDLDDCNPLDNNKAQNTESKKNIIQITTNNNPFLFPNNTFKEKKENNLFNNANVNVNSNNSNKTSFFQGKNLFNINGNNNNNSSDYFNFSLGKV